MKCKILYLLVLLMSFWPAMNLYAADSKQCRERRERAAKAFPDGVLLLHSKAETNFLSDGYREEAAFYYLTGLENSPGAILAVMGKSAESWLFVPPAEPTRVSDIRPGDETARKLAIDHVVDWKELEPFLSGQAKAGAKIYFRPETAMLPDNLTAAKNIRAPGWVQVLQKDFPGVDFQSVEPRLTTLMAVENPSEQRASEMAARATVLAFNAGLHAIHPGVSQRDVELAVVAACWQGARGVSFWPWAMAGANSVFPKPFESDSRYDHLDSPLQPGDLVRLDVGCEWEHYQGDLGRTLPVSGHFSDEQRETWNIFVAAYQAVVKEMKESLTDERAFAIWRGELLRHRDSAKTSLAQAAIAQWSDRKNLPYWQMHTMNLDAGFIEGPLRAGMVIDFEPIASIGDQGYYLEDMFLIGKEGARMLTLHVPYTAEEIEAQMAGKPAPGTP